MVSGGKISFPVFLPANNIICNAGCDAIGPAGFLAVGNCYFALLKTFIMRRLFHWPLPLLAFAAHSQGPHFSHQTIFVTDLNRSADFYEKVLQLKRISEPFHDNKHVWFRISEHGQLHVVSGAKEDVAMTSIYTWL